MTQQIAPSAPQEAAKAQPSQADQLLSEWDGRKAERWAKARDWAVTRLSDDEFAVLLEAIEARTPKA